MQRRPHVLVNMAMTADGKIDTVARRGARISGATDTARVDRLRAAADAVLVGGHTLLGEDPRLTVRDHALSAERVKQGRPAQPAKVGVASYIGEPGGHDGLPRDSRFLAEGGGRVIVCTTDRTTSAVVAWLEAHGAMVVIHEKPRIDLHKALELLANLGIERLLVEGGSTIVAALFEAGLVDELQLAVAPLLFGGEDAPTPVGGTGWSVTEAIRLDLIEALADADGDVVLRYGNAPTAAS